MTVLPVLYFFGYEDMGRGYVFVAACQFDTSYSSDDKARYCFGSGSVLFLLYKRSFMLSAALFASRNAPQ